jgi:alpha-ketoglutarate-dependent taurine dioxygenase
MMEIRRIGSQIGAEITGVDVRNLDDTTFGRIYKAWLDFNVIAVRDQNLTVQEFLTYSRRFGKITPHPSKITPTSCCESKDCPTRRATRSAKSCAVTWSSPMPNTDTSGARATS